MFAAEPVITSEFIFPLQGKHCHSSSIVQCPNGDLLAAWFYGSGERSANDVLVQGARMIKGAKEWSEVFVMADSPGLPDCNPVLFIDPQKKLWLFWIPVLTNRWERAPLKYRTSMDYQDNGAPQWSWQDVLFLDPGKEFPDQLEAGFKELGYEQPMWGEYAPEYTTMLIEAAKDPLKRTMGWMTRAKPIVLNSGRLVLPLYSDRYNISVVALSDDTGETWRLSKPIVGLGPIQPSVLQRKDGTVVAFMRDSGDDPKRVLIASSKDNGETWSVATDTDIPNPSSTAAVCALSDGRWVMACNDTENGRHQLAMLLSEDEGATWPAKRYLEKSEPGKAGYAYPTVIQARDGMIHVSYSYSVDEGKCIKHAAFNAEWILAGDN
ncbi:MAG: exo-alpha-sialidase [Candidatus Hydrogenedentes bacterium]|nr:exo-alpha-sialidase [Candidatus Hydrogenedentota bacterium]